MQDKSIKISESNIIGSLIGNDNKVGSWTPIFNRVSATINKLPASSNPEKPGIKEILEQLKTAIAAEPNLDEQRKTKALKQVEELAKASQISDDGAMKELADNAITMLKGIFSGLKFGTDLLGKWNELLPALSQLFGIG